MGYIRVRRNKNGYNFHVKNNRNYRLGLITYQDWRETAYLYSYIEYEGCWHDCLHDAYIAAQIDHVHQRLDSKRARKERKKSYGLSAP